MNKENNKQIPAFVIDDSALKNIFEGKNKDHSDDLLLKLKGLDDSGADIIATTTLSAFLRAIFLSDSKVSIGKIQKTLSFLQVAPSFADFKDGDAVRDEIIRFVQIMSGSNKLNKVWIGEGNKANICICGIKSHTGMNKKINCSECKGECYIAKKDDDEVKNMKADNIKNVCARCALLNHREGLNETQIKIIEHELSSQEGAE